MTPPSSILPSNSIASELKSCARDAHSPAFYSLVRNNNGGRPEGVEVKAFRAFFDKRNDKRQTKLEVLEGDVKVDALDRSLGLLPLIEPHVSKINNEIRSLENRLKEKENEIKKMNSPTVFTEGLTDMKVLKEAFMLFNPEVGKEIYIYSKEKAGHSWVADSVMAWGLQRKKNKAAALFDNDSAGIKSKKNFEDFWGGKKPKNIKSFKLPKEAIHLVKLGQCCIKIPLSLEELYPPFIWEYMENNGMLVSRTDLLSLNDHEDMHTTFYNSCEQKLGVGNPILLYLKKPKNPGLKRKIAEYIVELDEEKKREALSAFEPLIKDLSDFFTRE